MPKIISSLPDDAVPARFARLRITGSVGLVLDGKRDGVAHSVCEMLTELMDSGLDLSPRVFDQALARAGE
jgi:predicted nucleic acid-binding protein